MTDCVCRLEAATSRLEDIATTGSNYDPEDPSGSSPAPNNNDSSITGSGVNGTRQVGGASAGSSASASIKSKTMSLTSEVEDFDTLINGDLATFCKASDNLDPVIGNQAKTLKNLFDAQRQFILLTTKAKKPEMGGSDFMEAIKDTQEGMMAMDDIKQQNRASPFFDQISMVADGAQTLGWVVVEFKPADHVAELFGGAQIYGNKVLKRFREKDESQVEWVNSFNKLMRSLISYIKQHHPKGIQWNPEGASVPEALQQIAGASSSSSSGPAAPTTSSGGAPPPPPPPPPGSLGGPPPPPPPPPPGGAPSSTKAAPDMDAVFEQLNKGEAITSGLKKVDQSQMTHKNPSLRESAVVPERSGSLGRSKAPTPPGKKPKPESMRTKKPPRQELDGNKWIIVS